MRRTLDIDIIWEAQGKCCAVCGESMVPAHRHDPQRGWTIEHVYNRASRRYHADGNRLISHAECNRQKADREPTGCEVIQLHAANAKLGLELTPMLHSYRDEVQGPSALAYAFQMAMAA